jgi:hypothetical protein
MGTIAVTPEPVKKCSPSSNSCSTPSAILTTSPNLKPATDTENHLEVHHSAGRSHRIRTTTSSKAAEAPAA